MTIPTHLSRFTSDPSQLTAISSVLHPEKNRKKEFPSVAKLLDDLVFQDETHPDFLIRSSRIKSKSNPLAHRSPFTEHPTLCVHSSYKAKPSLLAPRLNRLDQSDSPKHLPNPSSRPDSAIPLLLQSSSEPNSETPFSVPSPTGSALSSASSSATVKESRKRPYASEDDDNDDGSSDSDETLNSALGLRINWKSQINQSKTDYDRVIACPSRTWLKRVGDESTAGCLVEGKETGNQLVGLIVPKSFETHQADKRRRYIHSPRFHQVTR